MTGPSLVEEVVGIGKAAGLDAVGVCDAAPFGEARVALEERKSAGLHGGMAFTYRNPGRSTDPGAALAGARALVVGARSYRRAEPDQEGTGVGAGPMGRVARYSWTDQYQPLRSALGDVAEALRRAGWRARVLADDNALVDRAAAVRAGLGWYGKNANVLLPGHGSWFVLGSVLTDAPLAPAGNPAPVDDGCGTCRRCLLDCPTGALVTPGRLDARRCLAWLVQAPGVFPEEYRVALGDRLYGCDECQERCPVNRSAARLVDPPPADPGAQPRLPVLDLLGRSDAELEAEIGRWYIPGREMRYVRRNALVVLGNTADPSDGRVVAVLAAAVNGPDPLLRGHAVWAAARLGLDELVQPALDDVDAYVREEAARAWAGRSAPGPLRSGAGRPGTAGGVGGGSR